MNFNFPQGIKLYLTSHEDHKLYLTSHKSAVLGDHCQGAPRGWMPHKQVVLYTVPVELLSDGLTSLSVSLSVPSPTRLSQVK